MPIFDANRTDYIRIILWVGTNVSSSVGLILTNKIIMRPPFNFTYVFTLTSIHFLATTITMELMALAQLFNRTRLPWTASALMSMTCALSVGLMNSSLKINSLGFYQLCKLLGVPWLVFVQAVIYKTHTSHAIKMSLTIILIGIALATIKYVYMSLIGCIVGLAAVIVTVQFQIWQGQKQHEYQLNALQINHAQALPTFFVCTVLAIIIEFNNVDSNTSIVSHKWPPTEIKWILLSAVLAACVNLCSYGLIGNTSTITFQVVGHAKTILVLIASYFLFEEQAQIRWNNVIGVIITVFGTILYGYLRHNETANNTMCTCFSQRILRRLFRRSANHQDSHEEFVTSPAKILIFEEAILKPV